MLVSLVLALWQAVDGEAWLKAFPAMFGMGDGRGGGLRPEPSLLAPILAFYISLALWRLKQPGLKHAVRGRLLPEVGLLGLTTLILTRSLSVAIILLCFLPVFAKKLRYIVFAGASAALLSATVFWARIRDAVSDGGTFSYLITTAVGSWRNVPDIVIFANLRQYLLPGKPADMRDQINLLATTWNPVYYWLDNTYSTFSASASTLGVTATALLFAMGLVFGMRKTSSTGRERSAWLLLYLANWFILPKYEPCGWVALGIMCTVTASVTEVDISPVLPAPVAAKA